MAAEGAIAERPGPAAGSVLALLDAHVAAIGADRLGTGPDPYGAAHAAHPMALALYAEGLATLATGHDDSRLAVAAALGDRLLDAGGDRPAWGLGFGWRGANAAEPYAITTAICGRALLALHRATGSERYRDAAAGAAGWLCDALAWPELPGTGHRGPAYSPTLNRAVPNVASMVAGFLWRAGALLDPRHADRAEEATTAVVAAQRHGCWGYGETGRDEGDLPGDAVVDLIHSSYTLAGLAECAIQAPALGRGDTAGVALTALREGLGFVATQLVAPSGWCREKVVLADTRTPSGAKLANRPRLRRREIADGVWIVAFPAESRLWGYGAWIAAVARAGAAGVADAEAMLPVLGYLWSVLAAEPSARFPLTGEDRRAFPRHEAHLFEGLAAARPTLGEGSG